jgi:hypothetical protein
MKHTRLTTPVVSYDLERLQRSYRAGFHDPFLDTALHKIVDYQMTRDEADLQRVEEALAEFEQRYGLSSDEFWGRFQAGQMADTADFMEWNVLCKMRQRIATRRQILRHDAHE